MPKLDQWMTIHSKPKATKHTVRKLITFTTSRSYKRCLKYLEANGIKPFKRMPGSRMIGCHFDKRQSWSKVAAHPDIKRIEKDVKIKMHALNPARSYVPVRKSTPLLTAAPSPPNVTWNVSKIGAPAAWKKTLGSPIKLAIIDTGIANHPGLSIAGGVNTIDGGSYADDNGHGTHVAGIAAASKRSGSRGVAPDVKLYAVKALNKNGDGYVSDIIAGVEWCINNKMQVINMSFGIAGGEASGALHSVIKRAARKGIIIIASAGNSGPLNNGIDEPASYSETIAVAASNKADEIASFSSRGEGIMLSAPGADINSTWLNGGYMTLSGTSMACPHVAGGAALLLAAKPQLQPALAAFKLRKWAKQLKGYPASAQGAGLLQLGQL